MFTIEKVDAPDATVFEVGDKVLIRYDGSTEHGFVYAGSNEDGIVLFPESLENDEQAYLFGDKIHSRPFAFTFECHSLCVSSKAR